MEFTHFNVEAHDSCEYDYVEIFNGGLFSSPSIGKFCDSNKPFNFTSQSNNLRLEFHTDSTGALQGFRLTYRVISQGMLTNYTM